MELYYAYIEKDIYRQMKIVRYLVQHRTSTVLELAKELSTSRVTIHSDLERIALLLPKGWELESTKGLGVQLHKPVDQTIHIVILCLAKQTTLYALFRYLIQYPSTTIKSIREELYTSTANINRALDYIEKQAQLFNLKLQRNPIMLIGNEAAIRSFHFEQIGYFYGGETWRIADDFSHAFYIRTFKQALEEREQQISVALAPHLKWDYILYVAIGLYRNRNGFHPTMTPTASSFLQESIEYQMSSSILTLLQKQLPDLRLSKDEIMFNTIPMFHRFELYKYMRLDSDPTDLLFQKYYHSNVLTQDFITFIEQVTGNRYNHKTLFPLLKKRLHSMLVEGFAEGNFSGFEAIAVIIDQETANQIEIAYQKLSNKYPGLVPIYANDLVKITKILKITQTTAISVTTKPQILIVMDGGEIYERHVEAVLKAFFSDIYTFILNSEHPLSTYETDNFFAVISDLGLSAKIPAPLLSIHETTWDTDIQIIINYLFQAHI